MKLVKAGLEKAKLRKLERQMAGASDYASWYEYASRHDQESGKEKWKSEEHSGLFDSVEVKTRRDILRSLLNEDNRSELLYVLNEGIHGNMGRMGRPILYDQAKIGTKQIIEDYVNCIVEALQRVADADEAEINFAEKLDFFRRASHCYGRSALMLSGGAGLVYFHHGVVQALIEQNLLPNVISGSSAGSWVAGQIGCMSDEELKSDYFLKKRYNLPYHLNPLRVFMRMEEDYPPECVLEQVLDELTDDLTFQEAFEKTGRHISIPIAPAEKHQTSRLMNSMTSPNVYIRSAMQASSSIPGVMPPVTLYAKDKLGKPKPYVPTRKWCDGSISQDLPGKRLSRLYGVNHYLVSLINPIALPFVSDTKLKGNKGFKGALLGLSMEIAQETLLTVEEVASRLGTSLLSPGILLASAVLDQKYTGDINIFLEKKHYKWRDALFGYADDESMRDLVMAGQRSTWPKISMIRNQTIIAHTLDRILNEMDQIELSKMDSGMKAHLTSAN